MTTLRTTFNATAVQYDDARPTYPTSLLQDIITQANLSPQSRILEIGCGTGQATIPLAQVGCRLVAIDPGERSLHLLQKKCQTWPHVSLIKATYEDVAFPPQTFDLIVSAQAFHWVAPEVASVKTADLLRPGGQVALFWHLQMVPPASPQSELQQICARYVKGYPTMIPPEYSQPFLDKMVAVLSQDSRFTTPQIHEYPWQKTYEQADFLNLFKTWSKYLILPPAQQQALLADVKQLLTHQAGQFTILYNTCLIQTQNKGL